MVAENRTGSIRWRPVWEVEAFHRAERVPKRKPRRPRPETVETVYDRSHYLAMVAREYEGESEKETA